MEQNIRLDVNHMMADMLGGEYGVTQAQLAAMRDAAIKAQHAVEANRGTGWLGWMNLPYNQEEIVSEIEKVAEHVRKTFKYFVVLGIGGSALGPIAVHQALNHLHYNELPDSKRPGPKFYVEDNIDPERMAALMDVIELDKACFCIISKSGGTAETMSQYLIVTEALKAQVGADWAKHIIAVTDHEKGKTASSPSIFRTAWAAASLKCARSASCPRPAAASTSARCSRARRRWMSAARRTT